MPAWVLWLGAVAFVITSLITIWTKGIRPAARIIAEWERMIPVWRSATAALEDVPEAFSILKEIVGQVRSNSGSTILDMIEKLSRQADEDRAESHKLAVSLEADRQMAMRDRELMTRMLLEVDHNTRRLDATVDALAKLALGDKEVAANLLAAQQRADAAPDEHGAAADAASESAKDE